MAKKKNTRRASKPKQSLKDSAKSKVDQVLHQMKEPLSLFGTLKEEGMANATAFLSMAAMLASGAKEKLRPEMIKPAVKDLVQSLGFAMQEDVARLEERIEELEQKLAERELAELDDEE